MTNTKTPNKSGHLPAGNGMGKSIFPTFNVNVPMPSDTAVPGSFNKPAEQSSSGATDPKPAKGAK
jgi:hypothetical protein